VPVWYRIGTGIAEVTDSATGLPTQGTADSSQITTGVESRLFARAFMVAAEGSQTAAERVAIVVADIWSCTRRVKDSVVERLAAGHPDLYVEENVLISGTHTHSAPGGYSGNLLYDYDFSNDGCDEWGADTDREMLLLKFVKLGDGGAERSVGALNWYPIHPTDRGQKNTLVTGDNRGYASSVFEQQMEADHSVREPFVAAFANANCGDVSGNVELGHIPDGIHDQAQMEKRGRQQSEVAQQLFANSSEEVSGPVEHRHTRVDFSNFGLGAAVRTWPALLGASFAAGSSEDSLPVPDLGFHEGMTVANLNEGDELISGPAGLGLSAIFGISLIDEAAAPTTRASSGLEVPLSRRCT
jgi:neutral ceramidase